MNLEENGSGLCFIKSSRLKLVVFLRAFFIKQHRSKIIMKDVAHGSKNTYG